MPLNLPNYPHIELVATSSLKPNPFSARRYGAKQLTQLGCSIERFGFLVPIIVDDEGRIVAGEVAAGVEPTFRSGIIAAVDNVSLAWKS